MNMQRRLGRGLEALLGQPFGNRPMDSDDGSQGAVATEDFPAAGIVQISVYEIESNPFQPRRDFDDAEIDALAQSIRDHGLLQPIVVRRIGERYQLIAGERRLRAATKAGWAQVPAQVREADDRQVAEIAIVENLQRKDLSALEKAASFQQYLQSYGCTQEELAGRLSLDRSTIANLIRLLELPAAVQQALSSGSISAGHARALLPLGDEQQQISFCQRIVAEELSVRAVEQMVQDAIQQADAEPLAVVGEDGQSRPAPQRTRSEHLASLEQELRHALGTKVQIRQTAKGGGKITIHFSNHDEFERLRAQFSSGTLPQSMAG